MKSHTDFIWTKTHLTAHVTLLNTQFNLNSTCVCILKSCCLLLLGEIFYVYLEIHAKTRKYTVSTTADLFY